MASFSSRLNTGHPDEEGEEGDADVLGTPAVDKKKWGDAVETPGGPPRSRRAKGATSNGKGATLTLRDQEKVSSLFLLISRAFSNIFPIAHRQS